MVREVVFRPQAEDEVIEVRAWYESRRRGLGRDFIRALDVLVAQVTENPLAFPRVHGETRRALFKRFPYAVYFHLTSDAIVVLAVHGRQDPERWRGR